MSKSRAPGRFVLTFDGLEDPSPDVVQAAKDEFRAASVAEVMPGVLSVEGRRADILKGAMRLTKWRLAPEGRLSSTPPSKSRLPQ